jgi:tetratricopeptide (TPR) repeat protein
MKSVLFVFSFFFISCVLANPYSDSLLQVSKNDTSSYQTKVKAFNLLSSYYNRTSLDTSLFYAEKSFKLSSKNSYKIGMSKAHLNKAIVYSHFQKRDSALTNYKTANNYAEQTKDMDLRAMAMLNYGINLLHYGFLEEAMEILDKTKNLASNNQLTEWELKALNSIGNANMQLSDYSKAQVAFHEALEINKEIKNDFYETVITNNIGNIYFYLSNYDKAIEYYYLSLKIAEKINQPHFIQTAYINIGLIYKELKKYDESISIIKQSIEYFLSTNDLKNASGGYNSLGQAYQDIKKIDSAFIYLNKALVLKNEIKDSASMAMIYNNLGELNIKIENYAEASKNLKIALELSNLYSDDYNSSIAYSNLGKIYLNSNEKKALKYYDLAISTALEYGINDVCIESYDELYKHYKSKQNYNKALEYYEKFTILSDSINGTESKLKVEDIETKYEVDKKDQEIELLQKEQEIKDLLLKTEQEKSQSQKAMLILALALITLGATIVIIWFRNKQKTKINQLEKRGLKVETQMLRSQMNPHFIFNSLNSIQSFISENDTIDAERYLAKFAKLMRLILDNSRQSYITLEDEINTLKLYLELEQLRFDKRFDYQININDVDDEFTLVPPMLAQPYVENAILHGLASKTGGLIKIDYKQSDEKITCTIDDNGIGRKASEALKKETKNKKSSLGIKVTQERIDLLSEERKLDLQIEIIDKYENETASGTKVIIEMPYTE